MNVIIQDQDRRSLNARYWDMDGMTTANDNNDDDDDDFMQQ